MSTDDQDTAVARAIIDANVYLTLGTADADGDPWVCPVYFASDGYTDFYWMSQPTVRHSRNIEVRPRVSIVVFDSRVPPGTGQAVYMSALAEQVPDDAIEESLRIYPGAADRGARTIDPAEVRAPGPYRLYRAAVSEHWILAPEGPDHRIPVRL